MSQGNAGSLALGCKKNPDELRAYKQKKNNLSLALIVMIDADLKSQDERKLYLEMECRKANVVRENDDAVAIFVPTRNIETWIAFLRGEQIDETTDYKPLKKGEESFCLPSVKALLEVCRKRQLPPDPPSSLCNACSEYHQRIEQRIKDKPVPKNRGIR